MKILKLLVVLFLFVGVVRFSQEDVFADNPCTQACGNNYTACLQDDQLAWEICVQNVLSNHAICELNADQNHQSCSDSCAGITACQSNCDQQYNQALESCFYAAQNGGQACDQASGTRQAFCSSQFDACLNACPPD